MDNRRDFLRKATSTLPAGIAGAFMATGCKTASSEVEEVGNQLGNLPGNIIYRKGHEGVWKGKGGSHIPILTDGGLLTPHPMSPKHFIVRHTLVTKEGELIFSNTFAYDAKKALSQFGDTKIPKGEYYALSFCNKHDLWLNEVTI